jgi:predicted RNase H-like HicB family nuclease
MSRRYHFLVDRVVHVPYTVEQDETGWWSAHASLPGGGANGEGQTAEEAVADLREALDGWFAEFGVPDELTITVRDVA